MKNLKKPLIFVFAFTLIYMLSMILIFNVENDLLRLAVTGVISGIIAFFLYTLMIKFFK